MNIDFATRPGFSAYVLLLMFSGLAMVGFASPLLPGLRRGSRILNAVFGVAFFCYGFYLAFLFQGGHYIIFFKAFVLPVLLILRSIGTARRNRREAAQLRTAQARHYAAPAGNYYPPPAGSYPPPVANYTPNAGTFGPQHPYLAPQQPYHAPQQPYGAPPAAERPAMGHEPAVWAPPPSPQGEQA